MNITPLGRKVLVKKLIQGNAFNLSNGLHVPNQSGRDDRHTVLAVGPKVLQPIIPGDEVYILPTATAEIVTIEGEVIKFVHEDSIYAATE